MVTLDLLGRRGALAVLWSLREGPATFRVLQDLADGMAANTLNSRLQELREVGLVERSDDGYRLTDDGRGLLDAGRPLLEWAHDWALRLPAPPVD
ncbi:MULTISPECIES: helix-turn-helix domain-containing protein [Rhodococcus]|uniref:Helix-turn-helix domain-containing protein n=2 Tax=Rhodococcus oxybenzonivorans TaxID=1990687 RepID=A0AAE4UXG2_9NOCA|nr:MULTISPECIES: helix-turn-helix domain-containing protein [Rhodococcus]MDV7264716.1 helix-turn-helix domain-containing protein [Rhodococcus oxybenzonivorans]MDV7273793.1 helix-turn-helix domain-containing protein [Rhodococcus oxybenzonivorans]MDV7333955.1 helix-turn-helix domain-containing protein [Rhodococcus oxybenzonivorans]MDV7343374.1 helix-turn-helix domain-containing protein [Rhodococcus oxybenzonivorans]MDV8102146.1 helix-turn-helix domain-containing protein [Rhodococcus sp. IEGM 69]